MEAEAYYPKLDITLSNVSESKREMIEKFFQLFDIEYEVKEQ